MTEEFTTTDERKEHVETVGVFETPDQRHNERMFHLPEQ